MLDPKPNLYVRPRISWNNGIIRDPGDPNLETLGNDVILRVDCHFEG